MRRCFLMLTLVSAVACGSDSTAPNPQNASIAGTWHLQTVNGQTLPFVVQSGSTKISITADLVVITDGGSWSQTSTFSIVENGGAPQQQVSNDGGTWARAGANLVFTSPTSGITNATFDGSKIVVSEANVGSAIYSR